MAGGVDVKAIGSPHDECDPPPTGPVLRYFFPAPFVDIASSAISGLPKGKDFIPPTFQPPPARAPFPRFIHTAATT